MFHSCSHNLFVLTGPNFKVITAFSPSGISATALSTSGTSTPALSTSAISTNSTLSIRDINTSILFTRDINNSSLSINRDIKNINYVFLNLHSVLKFHILSIPSTSYQLAQRSDLP
ncbi:hypothetical protein PoB_004337900 [Plakobranchus ocellatus]|uniref:Uncharacterized protein n=1 Tax=Plakobranchus ocellatus TaxID=259542 RepID=A0AAV4BET9_9GAST|nr:hypothetical protein PoB_004337900 [Plakobranchus ocellatus]